MLNAILTRWARTRGALAGHSPRGTASTLPPSLQSRSSSYPPPRGAAADSLWQSLLRWIPGDADPWAGKPGPARGPGLLNNLAAARAQFQASMQGLSGDSIDELQRSVQRSRSLRDLWYLRTWLYTEVARAFSQQEAERRLQALNALFICGPRLQAAGATAEPGVRAKRH